MHFSVNKHYMKLLLCVFITEVLTLMSWWVCGGFFSTFNENSWLVSLADVVILTDVGTKWETPVSTSRELQIGHISCVTYWCLWSISVVIHTSNNCCAKNRENQNSRFFLSDSGTHYVSLKWEPSVLQMWEVANRLN